MKKAKAAAAKAKEGAKKGKEQAVKAKASGQSIAARKAAETKIGKRMGKDAELADSQLLGVAEGMWCAV
eukprot:SAG22_NODE_265_length_13348_cov_150.719149_9_plen_69_part_00